MPSYFYTKNTLVADKTDQEIEMTQSIIGEVPEHRHTEAHDEFTRFYYNKLHEIYDGVEDEIIDKVASLGGYLYVSSIDYDTENNLITTVFESYFPTEDDYNTYNAWILENGMYGDSTGKDYLDPDSHPGRGYATIEQMNGVDFNKPYRD